MFPVWSHANSTVLFLGIVNSDNDDDDDDHLEHCEYRVSEGMQTTQYQHSIYVKQLMRHLSSFYDTLPSKQCQRLIGTGMQLLQISVDEENKIFPQFDIF